MILNIIQEIKMIQLEDSLLNCLWHYRNLRDYNSRAHSPRCARGTFQTYMCSIPQPGRPEFLHLRDDGTMGVIIYVSVDDNAISLTFNQSHTSLVRNIHVIYENYVAFSHGRCLSQFLTRAGDDIYMTINDAIIGSDNGWFYPKPLSALIMIYYWLGQISIKGIGSRLKKKTNEYTTIFIQENDLEMSLANLMAIFS